MTSFVAAVEDAERAQLIKDLKAARAELVARGRCTRELVVDGRVCAVGAVGVATVEGFIDIIDEDARYDALYQSDRTSRAWSALEDHVTDGHVMLFSDGHTDQDVLDLFDKTLADLGGLA